MGERGSQRNPFAISSYCTSPELKQERPFSTQADVHQRRMSRAPSCFRNLAASNLFAVCGFSGLDRNSGDLGHDGKRAPGCNQAQSSARGGA